MRSVRDDELRVLLAEVADELSAARRHIEHLRTALVTNRGIAMAVGILMARRGLTEDEAFDVLRDRSQQENRKVRDIADEVVYTGDLPEAVGG